MALLELEFSFLYFLQSLHTPFLDRFMTAVTFLGDKGWFFITLGVALFCVKNTRKTGAAVLISLAAGAIIANVFVKNIVMRDRPNWLDPNIILLIHNPEDYSFPSGHTLAAFETAVSILLYHKKWGIPAMVLASLIALSRLYLFVHFPTDVLSAMALGIFIAWYVHRTLEKYDFSDILRLQNKKNAE